MKDVALYHLFKDLVKEVLPLLELTLEKQHVNLKHDDYPELEYGKNGMPKIRLRTYNTPPKITELFRRFGSAAVIELNQFDKFQELKKYLLNHIEYRKTAYPNWISAKKADNAFNTMTIIFIESIIERQYHLNKTTKFDEEIFDKIYTETENYIFQEYLLFDIAVPILFLKFDFNEQIIDERCFIRRISDENHMARMRIKSYSPPIADSVLEAATHELVFKNYTVKKGNKYWDSPLSNAEAYPIKNFELFFNAIKIVTNNSSGFAQILVYPQNWVDFYHIDLSCVIGVAVKKYPHYFDNYYWKEDDFPEINTIVTKEIGSIFTTLLKSNDNKILIANRRLRSSYLRDNEDDTILDIIIALEILLTDNEHGELSYKLALRSAKLISKFNTDYSANQVFAAVKKIYAFRSALVHGSTKSDSKREIMLHEDSKPIKTISLANDYLREILKILLNNPSFLVPKEIDKLLLE